MLSLPRSQTSIDSALPPYNAGHLNSKVFLAEISKKEKNLRKMLEGISLLQVSFCRNPFELWVLFWSCVSCVQHPSPPLHTFSRVFLSTSAEWAAQEQKSASIRLRFLRAARTSWNPRQDPWTSSSSWLQVPAPTKDHLWPPAALQDTLWASTAAVQKWAMLSLSIIPAQCSAPPTTLTLAPPSRLCCHSTMAVRSSCVRWTTATAPACPQCPDTMATPLTPAHPLSPGHRSSRTQCPPQLPPCPSQCRTSQCAATGLAPHKATGTLTSTASMENLLLSTMSQVNHVFSIPAFFLLLPFPFAFSLYFASTKTTSTVHSNGTLSHFILVEVSLVDLTTKYLPSQVYKIPVCQCAVFKKNNL